MQEKGNIMYSRAHNIYHTLILIEEIHLKKTMNPRPVKSVTEELLNGWVGKPTTQPTRYKQATPD